MFITVKRAGGVDRVYLAESYREEGKMKQRIIKSFGRKDQMTPEEFEQLKDIYSNTKAKLAANRKAKHDEVIAVIRDTKRMMEDNNETSSIDEPLPVPRLRYGHLLLHRLWDCDLRLNYKLDYMQDQLSKISSYKISNVAFYLSALKLLDPRSHLAAFENQTSFLCNPIEGIALDNIYAALDFLGEYKDDIMKFTVSRVREQIKSKPKLIFYDCTNCYFEAPLDDKELFIRNFKKKTRAGLLGEGRSAQAVDAYLKSDEFKKELEEAIAEAEDSFYRMRGLSKEMRYDLPLVSVALVVDELGIPLDFQVYEGNCSEFTKMPENIEELKRKYDIEDVYVTADRGLNSAANLHMLQDKGLGFIVAQRVSNQKPEVRAEMLSKEGWKTYRPGKDDSVGIINTAESEDLSFRYKVCNTEKRARILKENGRWENVTIKCKIMYTYSKTREARDLQQIEKDLEKAKEAIKDGELMGRLGGSGWRGLVTTSAEKDEENKEIYRAAAIKESVLEDRKAIAGYAAIVYAPSPRDKNAGKCISEEEVLKGYRQLVHIEGCFRIMKSNFSIRPMYVRIGRRIIGHCLMCVLALIMLRLIEINLSKNNWSMSTDKISQALLDAEAIAIDFMGNNPLFLNSSSFSGIYTLKTIKKNSKRGGTVMARSVEDVVLNYRDCIKEGTDLNKIIKALGFRPLPKAFTLTELGTCLGRKFKNKKAVIGEALLGITDSNI